MKKTPVCQGKKKSSERLKTMLFEALALHKAAPLPVDSNHWAMLLLNTYEAQPFALL